MKLLFYVCVIFFSIITGVAQTPASLFETGKQQFTTGDYNAALLNFEKALTFQSDLKELNYYAGMAEFNLKNYPAAIKYYKKEIKHNKQNLNAYIFLARSKGNTGHSRSALKTLNKALTFNNKDVRVYLEKADIRFKYKNYKEALTDYDNALSIDPKLEMAFYKIGFCNYYMKDTIRACENWNKIEDLDDYERYEEIQNICAYVKK